MTKKTKDRLFLVSWDQLGLEALFDLTKEQKKYIEKEKLMVWAILKGENPNKEDFNTWLTHTIHILELRARMNSQRHYEIYTFKTDYSMSEEEVRDHFESAPQQMADLIRGCGNKIYSDRISPTQLKIV